MAVFRCMRQLTTYGRREGHYGIECASSVKHCFLLVHIQRLISGLLLVHIIACRLIGTKLLPELKLLIVVTWILSDQLPQFRSKHSIPHKTVFENVFYKILAKLIWFQPVYSISHMHSLILPRKQLVLTTSVIYSTTGDDDRKKHIFWMCLRCITWTSREFGMFFSVLDKWYCIL